MKMIPVFSCILALAFALLILAPLEAADPLYHELKKGDTLFSIARKFAIPYEALAVANGISDPTKLRIGDRLVIPEMVKVESGDSLSGIARMYGISSEDIRKANRLAVNAIIQPGDILVVPATRPSPPKTTAPPSASASSTTSLPRTSTSTMPATTTR
jgi:LysM repeat protein